MDRITHPCHTVWPPYCGRMGLDLPVRAYLGWTESPTPATQFGHHTVVAGAWICQYVHTWDGPNHLPLPHSLATILWSQGPGFASTCIPGMDRITYPCHTVWPPYC